MLALDVGVEQLNDSQRVEEFTELRVRNCSVHISENSDTQNRSLTMYTTFLGTVSLQKQSQSISN